MRHASSDESDAPLFPVGRPLHGVVARLGVHSATPYTRVRGTRTASLTSGTVAEHDESAKGKGSCRVR